MMGLALGMFIALFAFGEQLLGYQDSGGQVQLGFVHVVPVRDHLRLPHAQLIALWATRLLPIFKP